MFTALASILGDNEVLDLQITAVDKQGRMKVIVKPALAKGANTALAIPLALAATPQELDAEFVGTLTEYGNQRKSLKEQIAITTTILAAAQQTEVGKATKGLQGKTDKPAAAPSSTDIASGDGRDDDENGSDGDDVLDGATTTAEPGHPIAPVNAPSQGPATPAGGNDDLLALI